MAERILVVDDNPQNLRLAVALLRAEGYEVRTAIDGEDALRVLDEFEPRLILMDLQLPGLDGLTLTRQLKADPARRHILIVALTAYAMPSDEQRARDAGCDDYVTKPIDTRALPGRIASLLTARSRPTTP